MTDELQIKDLPSALAALATHIIAAQTAAGVTSGVTLEQVSDLVIARLTASAPELLDTWLELVAQIEDNDDALATLVATVATKADSAATASALATKQDMTDLSFGHCRLALDGSDLRLSRKGGKLLTINGVHEVIPTSGVTLSSSGLTPGTLYYIYAFMSSGTMMLEPHETGHSTDTASGIEIKTGDATRTLVGMVRPVTGPAFADTASRRYVRSWYNRKPLSLRNKFTAARSTTSLTWAEVNTEIRCEFLVWGDENADLGLHSSIFVSTAGNRQGTALTIDGVAIDASWTIEAIPNGTGAYPLAIRRVESGLSEGYHYATLAGIVSSGTGNWHSGVTGVSNTTITGLIQPAMV